MPYTEDLFLRTITLLTVVHRHRNLSITPHSNELRSSKEPPVPPDFCNKLGALFSDTHRPSIDYCETLSPALEFLRRQSYSAILLSGDFTSKRTIPFLKGIRAGGILTPVILISDKSNDSFPEESYDLGGYPFDTFPVQSIPLARYVHRAIIQSELERENDRLKNQITNWISTQNRLDKTHARTQHHVLTALQDMNSDPVTEATQFAALAIPECFLSEPLNELVTHYQQLLRLYVIGSEGSLSREVLEWSRLTVVSGITTHDYFHLHLCIVHDFMKKLTHRSTQLCRTRADLLLIEVLSFRSTCLENAFYQQSRKQMRPNQNDIHDSVPVSRHEKTCMTSRLP